MNSNKENLKQALAEFLKASEMKWKKKGWQEKKTRISQPLMLGVGEGFEVSKKLQKGRS